MTALEDLLDQARDALLAGDLAALSGMESRLAAAADGVSGFGRDVAERLKRKAERNARLLQAAGRGVRAARDRMAEITAGPALATYDSQGRKAALSRSSQALGRF